MIETFIGVVIGANPRIKRQSIGRQKVPFKQSPDTIATHHHPTSHHQSSIAFILWWRWLWRRDDDDDDDDDADDNNC